MRRCALVVLTILLAGCARTVPLGPTTCTVADAVALGHKPDTLFFVQGADTLGIAAVLTDCRPPA